ncbi:MAG TPA: response regulator transcription factor [Catalimonadaceae bacterium]|nr:response regulator transcription factor [Catalimonadaceae bacterium]
MIQLAIVEDDAEIRNSLVDLLKGDPEIAVVKTFSDAESLISAFSMLTVDVVLLDIGLPGKSGLQALAELKPKRPEVQFLLCTVFDDEEKIFHALCIGATGYLLKNTSLSELSDAIKTVFQGGSMMSATIARKVVESFQKRSIQAAEVESLSARQWEILNYLDQGYRYKEIASKMNLSFETIRTYCRNIYELLQVHSRTDALNKVFPKS